MEEVFEWVADESVLNIQPLNQSDLPATKNEIQSRRVIQFSPHTNMLKTGNEPLRLFRELEESGSLNVKALTDQLPSWSELDPENCYLQWHVEIDSDATNDSLMQVFEWVMDEADIVIHPSSSTSSSDSPIDDSTVTENAIEEFSIDVPSVALDPVVTGSKPSEAMPPKSQVSKPTTASTPKESTPRESTSIRVDIDKVDALINMVGELVITQSMLGQLGKDFDIGNLPKLLEGLNQLEQNTRELQESVMRIRMLPISVAFNRFPRMVRDLSRRLNKKIELKLIGEQTELDKTVMEKIGDPLVHLVRNALDHGIEMPEERRQAGKSETGEVCLNAYHQSGNVVIEIKDDGKGLDRERILNKAIEKGLITERDAKDMNSSQVYDLIFQPGFSTAQEVSDVSGRGVGMDVVRRNIQALSGTVEIDSTLGVGSKITIRLPLTLAILDGQLVRIGNNTYIFPLVAIVESLESHENMVSKVASGCTVFQLRDEYVPIIRLYEIFGVRSEHTTLDDALLVVVENDGEKVAILVDELLAQQQVVIKSLEQNYQRVEGVSGATILGDGTVAMILDIPGLVKLAGIQQQSYSQAMSLSQSHYSERNLH